MNWRTISRRVATSSCLAGNYFLGDPGSAVTISAEPIKILPPIA
jgi:hypothetical protein